MSANSFNGVEESRGRARQEQSALVASLCEGNAESYETLVRRYGGRMLAVAVRVLRGRGGGARRSSRQLSERLPIDETVFATIPSSALGSTESCSTPPS